MPCQLPETMEDHGLSLEIFNCSPDELATTMGTALKAAGAVIISSSPRTIQEALLSQQPLTSDWLMPELPMAG